MSWLEKIVGEMIENLPAYRRADGSVYFRARIRLGDDSRVRVDVSERYGRAAGGLSADQRAELYAAARQEREDETGELLAEKRQHEADERKRSEPGADETCDRYFARFLEHRRASGKVRRARDLESAWKICGSAGVRG